MAKNAADAIAHVDTYEAEGTVWARTSAHGDDKDRPLIRSSDGSFLYYAADIAYVRDKFERGFERLIYVLGADHHGYIARLKAAATMLGYDAERLEVLLYQPVHLTKGGAQAKMSKRRGDVVFVDELMDEVGVDAARWYLVNRGPDQAIDIDIDLAAEKTQKNPVYYVQYAHARIAGILRNAPNQPSDKVSLGAPLAAEERELIKRLAEFPTVVAEATERRAPQGLPDLRDSRRRRLPSLLPRASRARERVGGVPSRALPRDPARDRALPRPRGSRGAGPDVRWTLLAAALLLAGCGRAEHAGPAAPAPPPALAKRCGTGYSHARTFWFSASDGTRLDGAELGRGPSGVVLLHESAPADLCGWAPYGARLARAGFHVLLLDLRGSGLSARGRYGGPSGAVADVRGAVDDLRSLGAKKVALVGASYGGVNALVAAPALGARIAGVASLSGELVLGRGSSTELDALAAVERLRVPLLVLGSRDDRYLNAAEARRLVRAARSTHATLAEFDGTVHGWDLLSISPERKRADRILLAFLRRATQ